MGFSYFLAETTTQQRIPQNVVTTVNYPTMIYNRNNEYNVFSSEFTATRAGVYKFCAQAKVRGISAATSGSASLFLQRNASNIRQLAVQGIQGTNCVDINGCGTNIFLNPGDVVRVAIFATTSQDIVIESGYFEGARTS
ncbi:C1q-like domain-containing protein [Fictibacillus fluitans]|uniref:C1q-like domain-containing protein n=1 Tax=Fictibacillus fluitans TaxID=3058422 RepID=UPI0033AB2283